ncbi:hypothetical protein [Maritimibacter sp. UBA3975]|uniref:hypothetical protein n=1 Tax=Maritimibacter sp. UBA3975 TaxID=1946833 RepID=UPI0025BCEF88|nr:hypothetical protein [Maritimibacter sp. UBA3975]|tara:strand:+ start:25617 stop:25793 length:177 start_codon:yes stop_codon:yes gene_type:complete
MTAILITTVCIAFGQEAECQREVRIYDDPKECIVMRRPTREYLEAVKIPGGGHRVRWG